MTDNSKMIEMLSANLEPVKRVSLIKLFLIWLAVSVGVLVYQLDSVGIREDIYDKIFELDFILALIFYIAAFSLASVMTFRSVVPGRSGKFQRNTMILSALGVLSVLLYSGIFRGDFSYMHFFEGAEAVHCCLSISYGALLPAIILYAFCLRLAPIRPARTAAFGWVASATLVSIVSQLHCPVEGVGHAILGHGIMLAAVGAVAWLVFYYLTAFIVDWQEARNINKLAAKTKKSES